MNYYTNSFSGTSSASPIIAGAAALLQALHEVHASVKLGPLAMRALLADPATGTPQGPNVSGHIGVMPNLEAIVRDRLQLVPDIYLRRSPCDDGSPRGPKDEVSSSPDILVWPGDLTNWSGLNLASARFGEGNLRENLPAPGGSFIAMSANDVYVRLRNRGLGVGDVHVELFASPAATLITTERWFPVGSLDVTATSLGGVPQGDTLFVAGPIPVPACQLTSPPQNPLWSFLAVLSQPGQNAHQGSLYHFDWAVGLPPGPPYFDWAAYRAFLRKPGVAWRNTHRVSAGSVVALPFCIAGTPDRAREFDFEVIQRLPANANVTLGAPLALAAKLHQRQPSLVSTPSDITLSHRPRTRFSRVQLAACACADATFKLTANSTYPLGHSLAIRQLWRGEEVGRITWYFTLDK